ncbi:MAG: hypothetical protein M3619_04070 [Myxococcota bacterium]|nr:hypothetical protein [Myxococcota bacterium]
MDLEIHEALALSADRDGALALLLPGSEDHDYYRCLRAQHAGALDDAEHILRAWPERHGSTARYERLQLRQLLYRNASDPARTADRVRDYFGVNHWHEADVEEVDPTRPTRLADGAFDGVQLLADAVAHDPDLSMVSDEGLHELIAQPLDPARRRVLLSRIHHTPQPEIVGLVADDLAVRGSGGLGSLAIHEQLTLEQLVAVAGRVPELRGHANWVYALIRRMRPHYSIALETDRQTRIAYLRALWAFVGELPPSVGSLKAHVLWHLLDTTRRLGQPIEPALVRAYLSLPRTASYVSRTWIDRVQRDHVAQLGVDLRNVTGLPPAGSDEELVRDLIQRRLDDAEQYSAWLDRAWLEAEIATAILLLGGRDPDRATLALGPARAAALRERVELAWCLHNPTRFGVDWPVGEPIVLEADVKHVGELVIKVFRVDPIAYFQHHRREVNTDLDLDGLAASHEFVVRFAEPPIRRVRHRIELPMCARAGTYVVDLIGNGIASRALIYKGRLRHTMRASAAGQVVTILDEAGIPQPGARAWIGDREYVPDERGTILVPFSTNPGVTPMLLTSGDIATVRELGLVRETYHLAMNLVLDRQALAAGRTVQAIARIALSVAGVPASLALLKRPTWEITLTDRHGVTTTKSQPLVVEDGTATLLEWPLGEDTAHVAIGIRAVVEVRSEQREQELAEQRAFEIATIHGSTAIEALYLSRGLDGWAVSALGKSGEPRAARPITIALVHRWARTQLNAELATDARGRVELGQLPGVEWISSTLGGLGQQWLAGDVGIGGTLHVPSGREVTIPVPPGRTAADVLRRASLVELCGGVPARHPAVEIEALEGAIVFRGLPAGEYELRAPGIHFAIVVADAIAEVPGIVITPGELMHLPRAVPAIAAIDTTDGVRVTLRGAAARTVVHVIATRFASALVDPPHLGPSWTPGRRADHRRSALYVSGRDLGDEYRYILERRGAKRHPSMLLDKPTLLLNPWSRRTTTTDIASARAGDSFRASAPPPAPGMAGGRMREAAMTRGRPGDAAAFASHDFLPDAPGVFANLEPDAAGVVHVPRGELGAAAVVTIIVDDPAGTIVRRVYLGEPPLAPRDLRLRIALDPARHAAQRKRIAPLAPGATLVIEDLATAKLHLIDSVERAHAYLLALRDDPTLREFAFVTRWHTLVDAERRELYSKYACHELHLFVFHKDRPFFDDVIRPYLAHKRVKTFVDHWLLDADLASYLEPTRLLRLNAVELALLAQRVAADDRLARILGDQVAILPPDPARDMRLIDALIGASTLDGDDAIEDSVAQAQSIAYDSETTGETFARSPGTMPPPMGAAAYAPAAGVASPRAEGGRMSAARPAPKLAATVKRKKSGAPMDKADLYSDDLDDDMDRRDEAPAPHYRAADKTQEWAENNWWHLTPAASGAALIAPNRLWRDLALHRGGAFLSASLGLATGSFAEAMCALAVTDVPCVPAQHAIATDGPRMMITAACHALAGSSQLTYGELVTGGPPLVVGMSYVRADDRHDWSSGEQVDKYVEGPLATGVVYTCQIVIANPSSSRQRISALVQVPRGSITVGGGRATDTIDVLLAPYGTHGHEVAFYFPAPGTWSHFPVNVSRGDTIVAVAPARPLEVISGGGAPDASSWSHVAQRGSAADVVAYLATANLAATDLGRIAWRMRDRPTYELIVRALEARRAYDETLWGYALVHRDAPRIRVWLRSLGGRLLAAGPVLDVLGIDAEDLGTYEHLELAPLINARAHRLGPKLRILNDGLAAQYQRFLDLVAHRPAPTPEDLLAAAAYLMTQDRVDASTAMLARVDPATIADRMQHDYLAAYVACLAGDVGRARELATRWREHPVDRWRHKFGALVAMLDEVQGAAPAVVDSRSREQQHADLAARQPTFELALDREGIAIHSQHVRALELRFFEMDIELLFSRQPFVQSDVSRFSFIEPGHREQLAELAPEHRVRWPAPLVGKNVVVEAVGAGQRKAKVHYANDLVTSLANQVGQVRVQRASDRAALPSTYVKVYARKRGGTVTFYKDGYTDLRGWFDYATLSTTELDDVERFAILVCSDTSGASILEASPPVR